MYTALLIILFVLMVVMCLIATLSSSVYRPHLESVRVEKYRDPQNVYGEKLLSRINPACSGSGGGGQGSGSTTAGDGGGGGNSAGGGIGGKSVGGGTTTKDMRTNDDTGMGYYATYVDERGEPLIGGAPGVFLDESGRAYRIVWFPTKPNPVSGDYLPWSASRFGRPKFSVRMDSSGLADLVSSTNEPPPFTIDASQCATKTSGVEEIHTDRISSKKTKRVRFADQVDFGEASFSGNIVMKGQNVMAYDETSNTMRIG